MRPQASSAVPPTTVVGLSGTCWLYPDGTTYGGGPASHRDPDADPVEQTPVRTTAQALAELGSVGDALRWALERELVSITAPQRQPREGSTDELLEVLAWDGEITLAQWREFAELYLVETDANGHPLGAEVSGEDQTWQVYSDGMSWNVGGITRVHHAELKIALG